MPRFQMDDSICNDPAVIRAGTAAFGLYSRCGGYVAQQLLDGHVPSEVAAQWGTPEWVSKLVAAGLWETEPGGYWMPRYLDDNPSREKVLADRKAKAERQQRWLENKRNASSGKRRSNRPSRDASQDASLTVSVDAPLPPSLREGRGSAPATPGGARSPRQDGKTVAEALSNGHARSRPLPPEEVASRAAAIRQSFNARRNTP
jgi:hypothetical protein